MHVRVHCLCCCIVPLAVFLAIMQPAQGQLAPQSMPDPGTVLPNAPMPAPGGQGAQDQAQQPAAQSSSSSQSTPPQADSQPSQRDKAQEQLKEEEKQRILGVAPNFNVSYLSEEAVSLSAKQKMDLAFHSSIDPFTFFAAALAAGYHEANDDYGGPGGYGWGAGGYGKRAGAAYLDAFDGTVIGNGILPAIFHQDPRYFRMGHGTFMHRFLYSAVTTAICKGDKTRHWQPNYSNVGGNIIAGGISNLYYPSQNSGWGQTITNGMIVTAEGTIGAEFDEFWPDISRKFFHRDPTHGRDAQIRAADAATKKNEKQPLEPAPK
jgi:hypothetical protein